MASSAATFPIFRAVDDGSSASLASTSSREGLVVLHRPPFIVQLHRARPIHTGLRNRALPPVSHIHELEWVLTGRGDKAGRTVLDVQHSTRTGVGRTPDRSGSTTRRFRRLLRSVQTNN